MKLTQPFVLYRLPHQDDTVLIIDEHPIQYSHLQLLNENFFICQAFKDDHTNWAFRLNNSTVLNKEKILDIHIPLHEEANHTEPYIINKQEYTELINAMVNKIENGDIGKGVMSRIKKIERNDEALNKIFMKLCESYPNAFIYLLRLPNNEFWCGASPEVLAQYKDGNFNTMALAGTQLLEDKKREDFVWEKKEVDEQIWVQKHIIDIFKRLGIQYKQSDTYTAQAGKIAHLCNDFSCNISTENAGRVLDELHPTPAICGTPTIQARDLILQLEKHDRKFYTGYLGLYSPKKFQLFVNLRCMMLNKKHYYLFVGGGITADSQAEKEWIETENKAQTLASIISSLSSN